MSSLLTMHSMAEGPLLVRARIAGGFYMITVVMSLIGYFPARGTPFGHVSMLVGGAAYLVVTLLLYDLLKPVSQRISLLAAFFSLEGIAHSDDSLWFFGIYCVLLGYLIFRSAFLPRALGVLMALAGLGLLNNAFATLLSPAIAHSLSPFALGIDGVGEISFALWLLVMGVNARRWEEQASAPIGRPI